MWLFTNFAEFPCESLEALTTESTRYSGSNTSAAMSTFDLVGVAYVLIHIWQEIKKNFSMICCTNNVNFVSIFQEIIWVLLLKIKYLMYCKWLPLLSKYIYLNNTIYSSIGKVQDLLILIYIYIFFFFKTCKLMYTRRWDFVEKSTRYAFKIWKVIDPEDILMRRLRCNFIHFLSVHITRVIDGNDKYVDTRFSQLNGFRNRVDSVNIGVTVRHNDHCNIEYVVCINSETQIFFKKNIIDCDFVKRCNSLPELVKHAWDIS